MSNNQTITPDDYLGNMHRNARKRKKRKFMITLISIVTLVLLVVIILVSVLQRKVSNQIGNRDGSEVISSDVTVGSINTTVSGSGILAAEEVEVLDVLSALEIIEYYVEAGDSVDAGDLIATVTNASLLTAMSDKQAELDELDDELADVSGDTVSSTISAGAAGRVKAIYAEKGNDVATTMYEHGALILLSLDGYLAADVASDNLVAGNEVTVILSDGSRVDGIVEKVIHGTATILVTDNGTPYGDTVQIADADGNTIGESSLYIHSQMNVTGYAGTVSSVNVSENDSVSAGKTLLKLTDTESSANYDELLKERGVLEEDLAALIKIYKEGGICSPIDGKVDSVGTQDSGTTQSETGYMLTGTADTSEYITVAEISSNTTMTVSISVDETDILSLEEGQEAYVSIDSIGTDSYSGTVTEINTTATSSSGVTIYTATISFEKTEQMLSGMSASVVITISGTDNAKLLPVEAVHQTSATAYVYTTYDEESGEFSGMKEVTIGMNNGTYVEIKDGLEEGETVYYTESETENAFGGMMNFDKGSMPDFSGGSMPDFGGNMSDFSSGGMPSDGNRPGGN